MLNFMFYSLQNLASLTEQKEFPQQGVYPILHKVLYGDVVSYE